MNIVKTKFKSGRFLVPVTLEYTDENRIFIKFGYNESLLKEVRSMEGRKWHGYDEKNPIKAWSVANTQRNQFTIRYLEGKNPYKRFKKPLEPVLEYSRPVFHHQKEMTEFLLERHEGVLAVEMGAGKTLAAIEIAERFLKNTPKDYFWYVAPKSALYAVERQFKQWKSSITPKLFTYESFTKTVEYDSYTTPCMIIFDECHYLKSPNSKRTLAALHLTQKMRDTFDIEDRMIVLMSGTPSPNKPEDWWPQCEIACPGYLKEGSIHEIKRNLSLIEDRESVSGGVFPHVITYFDDENKCQVCGQYTEAPIHDHNAIINGVGHTFNPSINEVARLYKRMSGLVYVKLKKDCMDLPEKIYDIIRIKPSVDLLRTAQLIKANSTRAITALIKLRELADGFQYVEEDSGEFVECPNCKGNKTMKVLHPKEGVDITMIMSEDDYEEKELPCDNCDGSGQIQKVVRNTNLTTSPKDEVYINLLDEYEESGRFIVWGGFTATIDKLCDIASSKGWAILRMDGQGLKAYDAFGVPIDNPNELLIALDRSDEQFNEYLTKYPKVCFVGHPDAGGTGLTLTGSHIELFYSNSFKGASRWQSEERFHRAGMDLNKAARVVDLVLLPIDMAVIENLKKKKDLQYMTMGELDYAIKQDVQNYEPNYDSK